MSNAGAERVAKENLPLEGATPVHSEAGAADGLLSEETGKYADAETKEYVPPPRVVQPSKKQYTWRDARKRKYYCITYIAVVLVLLGVGIGVGYHFGHKGNSNTWYHEHLSCVDPDEIEWGGLPDNSPLAAVSASNGDRYLFFMIRTQFGIFLDFALYSAASSTWTSDSLDLTNIECEGSYESDLSAALVRPPSFSDPRVLIAYETHGRDLAIAAGNVTDSGVKEWTKYTSDSGIISIEFPESNDVTRNSFALRPYPAPDGPELLLLAQNATGKMYAGRGTLSNGDGDKEWNWEDLSGKVQDALPDGFKFGTSFAAGYSADQAIGDAVTHIGFADTDSKAQNVIGWVSMHGGDVASYAAPDAYPAAFHAESQAEFNRSLTSAYTNEWDFVYAGDFKSSDYTSYFLRMNSSTSSANTLEILRIESAKNATTAIPPLILELDTEQTHPTLASTTQGDSVWLYYQRNNVTIVETEYKLDAANGRLEKGEEKEISVSKRKPKRR